MNIKKFLTKKRLIPIVSIVAIIIGIGLMSASRGPEEEDAGPMNTRVELSAVQDFFCEWRRNPNYG